MPLSMPSRPRQADLFQRALEGRLPAGPALGGYVEVAERLGRLVPTTSIGPSTQFRAELHERLVQAATGRAATLPAAGSVEPAGRELTDRGLTDRGLNERAPADRRRRATPAPWLVRGWRRTLASATAAVLTLMVGVGVAAGSALPGGLLYPVKELIQSTQLRFAGGDLDRGKVLLAQARGHIADASTLVTQGSPDPANVDTALRSAGSDLSRAQTLLLAQYGRSHDPAALSALARFATSQAPLLGELRGRVPVVSEPLVDRLIGQLGQTATTLKSVVAQCGSGCSAVPVGDLPGPTGLVGSSAGLGAGGTSGGVGGASSGLGGLLGPGFGGSGAGAGSGASAGTGGGAGGAGGAASIGSGGVGLNLPGVGATVPAPKLSAGSGGVHASVPPVKATLGPITATVPGVGVSLPPLLPPHSTSHSSSQSSSSSSSVCVLIICVG